MTRDDFDRPSRRGFLRLSAAAVTAGPLLLATGRAPGQYRPVDARVLERDQPGDWTLHFEYRPVRILTVDVPKKGRRPVWYMVYRLYNKTDTPQRITPTFELVTKDPPLATYLDEPYPTVVQQIAKVEDPDGLFNLRTTVALVNEPIPVTKVDSVPRYVHGVAVWVDVIDKSPRTNLFSVYVTGLSNGLSRAETDGGGEIIRRKTLQLDFVRPTDNAANRIGDIRPADNNGLGAEKWVYRVTSQQPAERPAGGEK